MTEKSIKKRCSRCNEELELDAFDKRKTGTHGRQSICRVCTKKKRQEKAAARKAEKQGLKAQQPPKHAKLGSPEYHAKMAEANRKRSEKYKKLRELKSKQWSEMPALMKELSRGRAMLCEHFRKDWQYAYYHNLWRLPQPHYDLVGHWNLLSGEEMYKAIEYLQIYLRWQHNLSTGSPGSKKDFLELLCNEPDWFEKMEKLCQCSMRGKMECPSDDKKLYMTGGFIDEDEYLDMVD